MFDHVTLRPSSRSASERFYATVLAALEVGITYKDEELVEWNDFSLMDVGASRPVTRRLHVGFVAPSRDHVERFWQAGSDAGYVDAGAPGERPQYKPGYYGAFLLDPDGNSVEAVHHGTLRVGGVIDHLWLRVSDFRASNVFYELFAARAGLEVRHHSLEHLQVVGPSGSFSVAPGVPTAGLHLAVGAPTDEVVDDFHETMTGAGFRDDGPPGERRMYHPGYYAAFVLDPDGNSIELVNHNR